MLTFIGIISCGKEEIDVVDYEIEMFKTLSQPQFQGKIIDELIYWQFGNWNNGIGSSHGSFWCVTEDTTIQQRDFAIYDYENRRKIRSLVVTSPAFSINDSYEIKKSIFEKGMKSFHLIDNSVFDGFTVEGFTEDSFFSSAFGNQNSSTFEIVKITELNPDEPGVGDRKIIRLWIIVNCNLYNPKGQKVGRIENGKFINTIGI